MLSQADLIADVTGVLSSVSPGQHGPESAEAARLLPTLFNRLPRQVGLLAPPSPMLFTALDTIEPARRPRVLALVPNVTEYVRDSSEAGMLGAVRRRLRRSNAGTLVRFARLGVRHGGAILRRRMGPLLALLLELELAGFRRFRPTHVVLAAAWTDLLLAAGNATAFAFYYSYVRRYHRALACLETNNGGHLLAHLRRAALRVDHVVTAVNSRGYRIKPNAPALLAQMRLAPGLVLAREVTAGGTLQVADGVRYARSCGAGGIVIEVTTAGDLARLTEAAAVLGPDDPGGLPDLARTGRHQAGAR